MKYPTLSIDAGREALSNYREGLNNDASIYVSWQGDGEIMDVDIFDEVYHELMKLASETDRSRSSFALEFESRAAAVFHSRMELPPQVAACREFWIWLTFLGADGKMKELVEWRFGGTDAAAENFGICSRAGVWEGLFARLWLRAEISLRGTGDYQLSTRGDIDIWRSHIFRVEWARAPQVASSFVQYQYQEGTSRLSIKGIRELAKDLRALHAVKALELLDSTEIDQIVRAKGQTYDNK